MQPVFRHCCLSQLQVVADIENMPIINNQSAHSSISMENVFLRCRWYKAWYAVSIGQKSVAPPSLERVLLQYAASETEMLQQANEHAINQSNGHEEDIPHDLSGTCQLRQLINPGFLRFSHLFIYFFRSALFVHFTLNFSTFSFLIFSSTPSLPRTKISYSFLLHTCQ